MKFEILKGLPVYGEMPEQFSETGTGTFREGLAVKFYTESNLSWIGNFQRGISSFDEVFEHPDNSSVIVIAGGQGYIVNPTNRELLETFGCMIDFVIPVHQKNLIIFGDNTAFEAYNSSGRAWISQRISLDGIRNVNLQGEELVGEAWSFEHIWKTFSLNINNGEHKGGTYF